MINYEGILWWHVFTVRYEEYFGRILYIGDNYVESIKKYRKVIVTTEQKSISINKLIRIDNSTYKTDWYRTDNFSNKTNQYNGFYIVKELPYFVKTINDHMFFEIEQTDIEKIYLSKNEKNHLNNFNMEKEDLIEKYYDYSGGVFYYNKDNQMIYLNLRIDSLKEYNWKNVKKINGT